MQELVVHVALVMAKAHLRCEGKEKEKAEYNRTDEKRKTLVIKEGRKEHLTDKVAEKKLNFWYGDTLQMQCVMTLFWFVILRTTEEACCLNKWDNLLIFFKP